MPTVGDLKKHLEQHFKEDDVVAYDIFIKEDVIHQASDRGIDVDDEQAESVLESMHQQRDATVGLNWDVMDVHIDLEVDENERAKTG